MALQVTQVPGNANVTTDFSHKRLSGRTATLQAWHVHGGGRKG